MGGYFMIETKQVYIITGDTIEEVLALPWDDGRYVIVEIDYLNNLSDSRLGVSQSSIRCPIVSAYSERKEAETALKQKWEKNIEYHEQQIQILKEQIAKL
jgi:hypothetical protein